jgi:hypothetical protein
MSISWFGLILMLLVVFFIIKGLANPRSRPFVFGLLFAGLIGFVFVGFFSLRHVQRTQAWEQATIVETTPALPPGYSSEYPQPPPPGYSSTRATETVRLQKSKSTAAAAKMAKTDSSEKAAKSSAPDRTPKPSTPPVDTSDDSAAESNQPPEWVNMSKAELQKPGAVYRLTREIGPYTTLLECERELPKAVQSAVSEYAQLALGTDQSRYVQLTESELRNLERGRWVEPTKHDLGGRMEDMLTLHLLVGIDSTTQKHLRTMIENAVTTERARAETELVTDRLKGAGVVLGGVLGFLALVWGGLGLAVPRQCAKVEQAPPAPAPVAAKTHTWSTISIVSVACVVAGIIAIAVLALFAG